jgi:hypothetical protein
MERRVMQGQVDHSLSNCQVHYVQWIKFEDALSKARLDEIAGDLELLNASNTLCGFKERTNSRLVLQANYHLLLWSTISPTAIYQSPQKRPEHLRNWVFKAPNKVLSTSFSSRLPRIRF